MIERPRYYLTTAIAYANNKPGLHTLYEVIGADVIARWHRMKGDDTRFLTGTDEHSINIAQSALDEGRTAREFVDEKVGFFGDVTVPDGTFFRQEERFTKTWKLQNTGSCTWTGYTIAFFSGDKMEAPDSVSVPETEAKSNVEVSVDLVAPATDGAYTGNFELRDAQGESIPLGIEPTFWVKIIVGEDSTPAEQVTGNCTFTENPEYVQTLIELINKERADVGRASLTVNDQLTEAARRHSLDMACKDFMKHSGSDGSWTGDRVSSAGYSNPYYLEILAIGLPQDAMNQWRVEKADWSAVLNSRVTEIGVGYVFSKFSAYGGYWTVVMGGP